jgi:hypothetical protein
MAYVVKIENHYEDGYASESEEIIPGPTPTQSLDDWFETTVWPYTGDGHGENLHACYWATILAAVVEEHVGKSYEWC